MQKNTYKLLTQSFGISPAVLDAVGKAEEQIESIFQNLDDIMAYNQYKVLSAFQKNNISNMHFSWNTGYGYDDPGRAAVERVYSDVFGTEDALVRPTIVNGTHALAITLFGCLRPGDELIYCTGRPYETLESIIGIRGSGMGSLAEYGITYKQVELDDDGSINLQRIGEAICDKTKMVSIQRSQGYTFRNAITTESIKECTTFIKNIKEDIICMVDNCYGEFLDINEPTDVGVDVMAGSLIKNPGGGMALTGGYVAGREDLIGFGKECLVRPYAGGGNYKKKPSDGSEKAAPAQDRAQPRAAQKPKEQVKVSGRAKGMNGGKTAKPSNAIPRAPKAERQAAQKKSGGPSGRKR